MPNFKTLADAEQTALRYARLGYEVLRMVESGNDAQ